LFEVADKPALVTVFVAIIAILPATLAEVKGRRLAA
jgi:hypothetical protein